MNNSLGDKKQNEQINDEDKNNLINKLTETTEWFTVDVNKQRKTADLRHIPKIYPSLSSCFSQLEGSEACTERPNNLMIPERHADTKLKTKQTLSNLNKIDEQKNNKMQALEQIEVSI